MTKKGLRPKESAIFRVAAFPIGVFVSGFVFFTGPMYLCIYFIIPIYTAAHLIGSSQLESPCPQTQVSFANLCHQTKSDPAFFFWRIINICAHLSRLIEEMLLHHLHSHTISLLKLSFVLVKKQKTDAVISLLGFEAQYSSEERRENCGFHVFIRSSSPACYYLER